MKKCIYLWNDGSCGVREDGVASCPCEDYSDDHSRLNNPDWEATYDRYHEAGALSAVYPRPARKNHFLWFLVVVIFAFLAFVFVELTAPLVFSNLAMGAEHRITHYDKDGNRTGYTRIEDGRESHFDVGWNRSGYSIKNDGDARTDHYDRDWNRQGHDERTGEKTDEEM